MKLMYLFQRINPRIIQANKYKSFYQSLHLSVEPNDVEQFAASKASNLEKYFTSRERDALSKGYSGPLIHTSSGGLCPFWLGIFQLVSHKQERRGVGIQSL